MEYCYQNFGSRFIWLTDDDFGSGNRAKQLVNELHKRKIGDDLMWFLQWRADDVVRNRDVLPKMRQTGLHWIMIGVERPDDYTLKKFNKNLNQEDSKTAIKLLKKNDIFAHAMFVIGDRKDTVESISNLRDFSNELDPDFLIFTTLTPFPGIELFEEAKKNGWIEDYNWSHYDMIHAIMPTESLSRNEVQEEVYECYRNFYGSMRRRFEGIFSSNSLKRRIFIHMVRQGVIKQLRSMF